MGLLYSNEIRVNSKISIYIPTVGEVLDNEDDYYGLVSMLTAAPFDYMVQLDEIGVDFSKINEFELFILLFNTMKKMNTSLIFKDMDFSNFRILPDVENGQIIIRDEIADVTIDRMIHAKIALALRRLHGLEKNNRRPGNDAARAYLLERAKTKAKRKKRRQESQLEQQIVSLVNTEQFKYDYDSVRNLTIYQFNESVRQIVKKIDYQNKMLGIYTGNIDPQKMSQDDLNWLKH